MFIKSNKVFDFAKWVALVGLPAAGTLYVALGAIWEFQNVQAVSGTILALDTFLGGLLHLSSSAYKSSDDAHDGSIGLVDEGAGPKYAIRLNGEDPDAALAGARNGKIVLRVNPPSTVMPTQAGGTLDENTPTTDPKVNNNGY